MSFVTFPLIFSFVPYRLACWPPPPKTKFIFIFVGKTKLWLTSKGIRCFFFVSGFHCRRRWPREEPKSGGEVPVQRLHRPIRHNCHTSSNSLICKQTIALYGCWDGRGEGVSDPQVVNKPQQATGTPASHQRVSCSLHTTALGFIVVFLPSKKSQKWTRTQF